MLSEVRKNIVYSNINIKDPEKFYNKWLNDLDIKEKKSKPNKLYCNTVTSCHKMNNKLDKIEELLGKFKL